MYFRHRELGNKGGGSRWLQKSQTTHNPEHETGHSEQQERGDGEPHITMVSQILDHESRASEPHY